MYACALAARIRLSVAARETGLATLLFVSSRGVRATLLRQYKLATLKGVSPMQKHKLVLAAMLLASTLAANSFAVDKPPQPPPSLKVGDVAPDFKLQYFDGNDLKDVTLSQYRGKKNVVLAFYIFAFTGG